MPLDQIYIFPSGHKTKTFPQANKAFAFPSSILFHLFVLLSSQTRNLNFSNLQSKFVFYEIKKLSHLALFPNYIFVRFAFFCRREP